MPETIIFDWKKIFLGNIKLKDIFAESDENELNKIFLFFQLMIENFHLDISQHPIGNYFDHFSK